MDTAILSALSALAGATLGAVASIGTTWLSQHYQDCSQRRVQDTARREHLFRDFIELAAKLYTDALTHDFTDLSAIVPLYALKAQIVVFAKSQETVVTADEVLRRIIEAYYGPNRDLRERPDLDASRHDILETFTIACREELTADASKRARLHGKFARQRVLSGARSTSENPDSRAAPATRPEGYSPGTSPIPH
jgi:hypothetical protein